MLHGTLSYFSLDVFQVLFDEWYNFCSFNRARWSFLRCVFGVCSRHTSFIFWHGNILEANIGTIEKLVCHFLCKQINVPVICFADCTFHTGRMLQRLQFHYYNTWGERSTRNQSSSQVLPIYCSGSDFVFIRPHPNNVGTAYIMIRTMAGYKLMVGYNFI